MAISAVGTFKQAYNGAGVSALGVTATTLGNAIICATQTASGTNFATGLSGGGCSSWLHLGSSAFDTSIPGSMDLWLGVVTATGSPTVSVAWNASPSTGSEIVAQEFTAGLGASTVWAVDNSQTGQIDNASSATITFPTLVPTGSGRLYVGLGMPFNSATAGSTSGYTYVISSGFTSAFIYNPSVGASTSPTAGESPAGRSLAAAALLTASLPATVIPQRPLVVGQAVARAAFF